MGFIFDFYPSLEFITKAILGTITTILFLIIVELLEVNNDNKELKEIFNPILFGLIITFLFIMIQRIAEVLK